MERFAGIPVGTTQLRHKQRHNQCSGAKAGAMLSLGWSTVFAKNSVLANRLPGTALLLRGDGKHYFIKIGDRESMYATVAVR
jgi:hypothetical protein